MEYASKQLLCAVHMRGGPQAPCGLLVSLDEMVSRYWSDSAAGAAAAPEDTLLSLRGLFSRERSRFFGVGLCREKLLSGPGVWQAC